MKNNKIITTTLRSLFLGVIFLFSIAGCESDLPWIDSDLNIDPDSPADVPMSLLLPGVQLNMGYILPGNNSVRVNNQYTQHFDGVSRQSYTETRYQLTPADVNNFWLNVYSAMLIDLDIMVDKAIQQESPHNQGVAQVLQATTLGITTDLFGDIPFSQALRGDQNILRAEYDSQEAIYDTIFALNEMAITNLGSSENLIPVEGDAIYDGNLSQWTKAANSISARHYLQLSNVLGNQAFTLALNAAEDGFTSNADDMLVPFEDANPNPLYQFVEQRDDIRMGSTFVNMLIDDSDPRLPFYVAPNGDGEYVGSDPGSQNDAASRPGPYVASKDSHTILMTYSELKFIEAEANFRLGNTSAAQDAYEEAVAASVLRVTGSANTAWLDANINGDAVTLEKILKQKYIDGFTTNQPYADWRRTGYPSLQLAEGAVLNQIPTRFPYAQNEIDYNKENVPTVVITDKVWWDQ